MSKDKDTSEYNEHDSTESRLLEAARKLLKRDGYKSLTIRGICKEADCSTSTFYQHFDSKDDLLSSFIQLDSLKKSNPDDYIGYAHPDAIIELYLQAAGYLASLAPEILRNYLTPTNLALDPRVILQSRRSRWVVDVLQEHFRDAHREGMFSPGYDGIDIYDEMNVIYFGYLFHWVLYDGNYELLPSMRKMLIRHLNNYLLPEYKLPL